jgi:hypothetical protein
MIDDDSIAKIEWPQNIWIIIEEKGSLHECSFKVMSED